MLKQQKIVIAECDVQKGEDCWEEIIVNLEPNETINDGMQFLRDMGWKFDPAFYVEDEDIKTECPFCNIGQLRRDEGLYLVDDEE